MLLYLLSLYHKYIILIIEMHSIIVIVYYTIIYLEESFKEISFIINFYLW